MFWHDIFGEREKALHMECLGHLHLLTKILLTHKKYETCKKKLIDMLTGRHI